VSAACFHFSKHTPHNGAQGLLHDLVIGNQAVWCILHGAQW
jgi:hypothetical protein